MYEHPYLSHRANELELEQLERAIARRRFLEEHADQIVLRPESALRRTFRRMLGMAPRAPRAVAASDAAPSRTTPDAVTRRASSDAASGSRRTPVPCEAVPAR
ncbi:hypothetical protein [Microbacterium aurantiacum]|uniref:hypothetical protein n=1 Tax=Microbacterium aurantiacum TaxID=162393 RepID=UPI0015E11BFB|nr:hypothetical protein [Microbacterium aurantiacum]